jgi:superfamily II DNA or RNA helicase
MSLRDLDLPVVMATSTVDMIRQFYVPALSRSIAYDRGVGFFSSKWLELAAAGLCGLANNGGVARLVASPILDPDDWEALKRGTQAQSDPVLFAALKKVVASLEQELKTDTLSAIAWMIADGLLEVRLAIPTGDLDGDFHDKFGIFHDEVSDEVAFHGSPNDSKQAFHNYESVSIFCSWMDRREAERVRAHKERFERIWKNVEPNLRVFPLPEAIRENIAELRHKAPRPYKRKITAQILQDWKWRHQTEAEREFIKQRRGILEMATGTGKTRTAIRILGTLYKSESVDSAILIAFGTDLLDQWYRELNAEGKYVLYRQYESFKEFNSYLMNPRGSVLIISRQMFADLLNHIPVKTQPRTFLIFDEVHGMGSETLAEKLAGRLGPFTYRLGLSATPEREYDAQGNRFIETDIGPVIFRFGLEDAIRRGILCEFDYIPLEYEFSDEDKFAVHKVFARYHAKLAAGESVSIEVLYQELARVRKLSKQKLPVFRDYLLQHPNLLHRTIMFVETADYGRLVQEIILQVSGNYHTYYADDERDNLFRFAHKELDSLLTCHRIAEGIDVQSTNNIVLFSASRARLETIQRIGRCLRVDRANPTKRALVVDFIRIDKSDEEAALPSADEERRDWLSSVSKTRREDLANERGA